MAGALGLSPSWDEGRNSDRTEKYRWKQRKKLQISDLHGFEWGMARTLFYVQNVIHILTPILLYQKGD